MENAKEAFEIKDNFDEKWTQNLHGYKLNGVPPPRRSYDSRFWAFGHKRKQLFVFLDLRIMCFVVDL